MRRVAVLLGALSMLTPGCSTVYRTVKVNISVPHSEQTELTARQMGDASGAITASCARLPCEIELERDKTYQITLRAVGYYPAVFEMPYMAAFYDVARNGRGSLVVPMVKRDSQGGTRP